MLEYIENENLFSKFFIGRKKERKEIIEAINSNLKGSSMIFQPLKIAKYIKNEPLNHPSR